MSELRSQTLKWVTAGHPSVKTTAGIFRSFPHGASSERSAQCSTQETFVWPVTEANYIIIMQQVNKWVMKRKPSAHLEALLHLRADSVLLTLSVALWSWRWLGKWLFMANYRLISNLVGTVASLLDLLLLTEPLTQMIFLLNKLQFLLKTSDKMKLIWVLFFQTILTVSFSH